MTDKKKENRKAPVKQGDEIEAEITDLAYGGEGVARYEGYTIFVHEGLPGDKVIIKVTEAKKNYGRGIIKTIIKDGDCFTMPVCPDFKQCGGCQWLHMKYEDQLKYKIKFITHSMESLAKVPDAPYSRMIHGKSNLHYRNRMQYKLAFRHDQLIMGFYEEGSHRVVDINECFIADDKINEAAQMIVDALNERKKEITLYDEEKHKGYLRQITIRTNQKHELLITFVVARDEVKKFITDTAAELTANMPEIKGIVVNFNTMPGNRVFGGKEQAVFGEKHLIEKVNDIKFMLGSDTFFQVNTKRLYDMLEFIDKHTKKGAKVLDLYGGIGALSLPLHKKFGNIKIVEVNEASNVLLKEILKLNAVTNAEAVLADAEFGTAKMLDAETPDVIIVDPPRKGIHTAALMAIKNSGVKNLIYISCNPVTFARDIAVLKDTYDIKDITPADLFPNTYHVETLASLTGKSGA